MSNPPDERSEKGRQRRQSIIAATLQIIERDGIAKVTHRTVAIAAQVRPSLVAYYFASLDDLLVAALTDAATEYSRRYTTLREAGRDALGAIAEIVAESDGDGRGLALAERELTLQAARRPALRPVASHWRDLVAEALTAYTTDPRTIRSAVAVTEGLCTTILLEPTAEPITAAEVRELLERVIAAK